MPEGDIETYHADGKWRNRVEKLEELPGEFDRKDDAVKEGREEARGRRVEHIVRNLDGSIGGRDSHGNDPRNVPG